MSNLKKFAVNTTGRLHLRDAMEEPMYVRKLEDGAPDPQSAIVANLYGPASPEYARATTRQSNRVLNRMKSKGKIEQTADQKILEDAEFLADITQSIENLEENVPATTNREKIKAEYMDGEVGFIRDQIAKYIGGWENFTKSSATS